MENRDKVVVACPKCGQKLRCEFGGAGTCPKCGTRVEFPENIYQADPALNRDAMQRIVAQQRTKESESIQPDKKRVKKKKKSIVKKIIVTILALAIIGGGAFGALKLKDFLSNKNAASMDEPAVSSQESDDSDVQTDESGNTDFLKISSDFGHIDYNGPVVDPTEGTNGSGLEDSTQSYEFSAGVYEIGKDIAPGVYNITLVSGSGNCFERKPDGRSVVNEIFGDTSQTGHIAVYRNAKLMTGGEVEIGGGLTVSFGPPS